MPKSKLVVRPKRWAIGRLRLEASRVGKTPEELAAAIIEKAAKGIRGEVGVRDGSCLENALVGLGIAVRAHQFTRHVHKRFGARSFDATRQMAQSYVERFPNSQAATWIQRGYGAQRFRVPVRRESVVGKFTDHTPGESQRRVRFKKA